MKVDMCCKSLKGVKYGGSKVRSDIIVEIYSLEI